MTDDFSAAASRLVEAARSARNGDCETAKIHIAQALELIHCHPSVHSASQATVRGGLAKWQARRLMEHIDAHLATKIHLDELALLFGFSAGHFCRVFKCTFGITAHAFITRRRIELAQRLMLTTRQTLSEIALSCGMGDQSHFTRSFRRIVGDTPYAWRRNRRGAFQPAEQSSGADQPVAQTPRIHPTRRPW